MRILIATAGSRGDVAPYTGLGVRLREAGHRVVIATHGRFGTMVRQAGLDFRRGSAGSGGAGLRSAVAVHHHCAAGAGRSGGTRPAQYDGIPSASAALVVRDIERLSAVIGAALRRAGVRAVVQSGESGLAVRGDDVLMVQDVPHRWLFPRTAAVVHHCGAGTTAAGLRAGVPTVPVPAQLDAPVWAARLAALGVAATPVPLRDLSADRLAAALRHAIQDPTLRGRARTLAARLATEDGASRVLAAVEQAADGRTKPV